MKRRSDEGLETPVASLIDVVFLLIIFFVVTASVEKDIIDETIRLAQAKYVAAAEKRDPRTVIINVRRDGSYNLAKIGYSPRLLRQVLINTRKDAGPDVPILIRASGNAVYRHVSDLQDIIKEAGFYRIKLAAVGRE